MNVSPSGTKIIIGRRRFLTPFLAVVAVLFLIIPNFAQETTIPTYGKKKKEVQGPRAIAVLEWTARGGRLIPISLKIDDRFYDAGLYRAQPVPMALDSGVIYEIQKEGEPLGDFTLEAAQQAPNGSWVGIGTFESKEEEAKRKQESAKAEAAVAKQKAEEEADEPPVLKRPKPEPSAPAATPKPSAPEPAASTPPAPKTTPEFHETTSDPNRPILRRGKPGQEQAVSLGKEKLPVKKPTPPPAGLSVIQVAVSDASPSQPHPYQWSWANPDEEQKMRSQAENLALATVADYATKTGGPRPGTLRDVEFHAYDLSFSNSPDIILSARVLWEAKPITAKRGSKSAETTPPPSSFEYYVTVVGREDIYGQLQKSFALATDNRHLDAFPKLQFIDVVDADGDGNGDLLFRSISDRSNSFVIYKELGFRLDELIRVPEPKE